MPQLHQTGQSARRYSSSRRHAVILPDDWNKLSTNLPSLSSYQDSESDNVDLTQFPLYHHNNESPTILVPRFLARQKESSPERKTFLDTDSDNSASSSPRTSVIQRAVNKPVPWSQSWPFGDVDPVAYSDYEMDYPEVDTMGPLGTLIHEFNDVSISNAWLNRPFARLEEYSIRDLQAQWMQRCQNLGERRIMRTVEKGYGIVVSQEMGEDVQNTHHVRSAPGDLKDQNADGRQ